MGISRNIAAGGVLRSGTAVSATGTAVDFTGIPSWVKRITVMFNGLSGSGSSLIQIQLGDSGGVETTGYTSCTGQMYNSAAGTFTSTTGLVFATNGASQVCSGHAVLTHLGSNTWIASGSIASAIAGQGNQIAITMGGTKTLSDTLDRIRITTVNGTDTFDAGTINILYE